MVPINSLRYVMHKILKYSNRSTSQVRDQLHFEEAIYYDRGLASYI